MRALCLPSCNKPLTVAPRTSHGREGSIRKTQPGTAVAQSCSRMYWRSQLKRTCASWGHWKPIDNTGFGGSISEGLICPVIFKVHHWSFCQHLVSCGNYVACSLEQMTSWGGMREILLVLELPELLAEISEFKHCFQLGFLELIVLSKSLSKEAACQLFEWRFPMNWLSWVVGQEANWGKQLSLCLQVILEQQLPPLWSLLRGGIWGLERKSSNCCQVLSHSTPESFLSLVSLSP